VTLTSHPWGTANVADVPEWNEETKPVDSDGHLISNYVEGSLVTYNYGPPAHVLFGFGWGVEGSTAALRGAGSEYAMRRFALPIWFVAVLFALLPMRAAFLMVRSTRRRRRVAKGCCENCGYDLRGSSDRCPECGRAFQSSSM
jgi:hypothetical protein